MSILIPSFISINKIFTIVEEPGDLGVSDVAVVPWNGSFKYLAFESGAEVHGLERLLGLLESSVVVFFSLGRMPRCRPPALGYVLRARGPKNWS
jgi:hypothetical protein